MPSITTAQNINAASGSDTHKNYYGPLFLVTLLFFMWGFITCMNDILIPHLKSVFTLQNWQAMLIQTAFFGAYFIISLLYYVVSVSKGDPIGRIGYKNGIIAGLLVTALGCTLFYPAATFVNYAFFLFALFVLAAGITILQIAANPYVTILGKPGGASSRLNMTQAFNSLGTTIAPLIGGYLVFGNTGAGTTGADAVKIPYIGLALVLILMAFIFRLFKLPEVGAHGTLKVEKGEAARHKHLVLGMVAIFAYVGGEVTIGSNLIGFAAQPDIAGLKEGEASHFLALFWGGAMVGRFFGAVALADLKHTGMRLVVIAGIAIITFITLFSVYETEIVKYASGFILLNVAVLLLGKFIPNRTLWLFSVSVMVCLAMGIVLEGTIALWAVVSIGLFNSIMFPTIFSLAIKGLGKQTAQGSSLLVMAIVGGALLPPAQGVVTDLTGSVQLSFVVPLVCYAYIAYYGIRGYKRC